ncbi:MULTISPECIES: Spy/CpxP family protein refolding chaperone [unclassified Neisseria]|uniref:Spy/CpxP family protein refolding chaperone n=1 Tax=unclassified Neisseria TaxID=2623750 RepID=UPI00266518AF|nr:MULTISPECIES: Spy/CpxP family protein refolding chaperone [unclassified Neisseria]MDO1508970.1 Spy/CpxP family protein refolding chaperone [Neisseria sp. MVDL19-042950]MDO1515229.1 Spy/CpxP family protein refolding chaperone [Neisseria sp. MVDL18-041461]MDO1562589.1 Spy/CpxP family protein refolding chaperone [Neisseria sp. MVDL20-010259]
MLIAFKLGRVTQSVTIGLFILCTSQTQAMQLTSQLDDFHPNCDVRPLGLSDAQNNELRNLRKEYKKARDKAARKADRINKNRRRNIIKILSEDKFDTENARDYVENRYTFSMDFAVDELAIQHRFYKLLSPQQRLLWLNSCLK